MVRKECKYCEGKGKDPDPYPGNILRTPLSLPNPCNTCKGLGFNVFKGDEENLIECRTCDSTGRLSNDYTFKKCDVCNGSGYIDISPYINDEKKDFWSMIDTRIISVAKPRFDNGQFADSVEASFKEINEVVKQRYLNERGQEFDGANLMSKTFSVDNPVIKIADLSTESGKNIQKGFLQIFSGAMTGIRNPKTHSNLVIERNLTIHYLFLASLLMSKIPDED